MNHSNPETSKGSLKQPCFAQFGVQGVGLVASLFVKAPSPICLGLRVNKMDPEGYTNEKLFDPNCKEIAVVWRIICNQRRRS